jgi:hypothetical protein
VLTEPEGLDRDELRVVLERHWGFGDALLEYMPVGSAAITGEPSTPAVWRDS